MGNRNCKSIRWTSATLLGAVWLILIPVLMTVPGVMPAHAQQPDASPPSNGKSPAASAENPARPPDAAAADPESMLPHFKDTRFWLSGQANFIFQTHPDFHADYSGKNSLSPDYDKATSRVMTLYTGVRINNS